jgi:hypothetical protein
MLRIMPLLCAKLKEDSLPVPTSLMLEDSSWFSSVISSLPTYYICSLNLPVAVIEIIKKYRKNTFGEAVISRERGII